MEDNKKDEIKTSKTKTYMKELQCLFKKISKDNMSLEIMFQEHDDKIIGSEDNITLFIKDRDTKEYRGTNLTYYFEEWNNENKEKED